jgi:hypothetical protein
LSAGKNDPVYTVYAAPLSRSEYIVNEGYQMMWFDPQKDIQFETDQAGNWGVIFKIDGVIKSRLLQYEKEPVITASYSDLVKFNYYPYDNIKVGSHFQVYSSRIAVYQLTFTNEGSFETEISVYPFVYDPKEKYYNISEEVGGAGLVFTHDEHPDGWMKDHNIPFQEKLKNVFIINGKADGCGAYNIFEDKKDSSKQIFLNDLKNENLTQGKSSDASNILALHKRIKIMPGRSVTLKIIRGVVEAEKDTGDLIKECKNLFEEDLEKYVKEDEEQYSKIPKLNFTNKGHEALYWNAFTLIRQCMLPPEGKCPYNYYVFSREPTWGWGYGGQVFHESLVMLAYAFMDPEGAMNSQRIYIDRQWENGYINYRTGPYLDEQIVTNGQYTSSAPWYNWQNYEIYKITRDTDFLEEAYNSGKRFYNYYVSNRDEDKDGLCEWGAHAVLESVRDARVAIWDEVADPVNFDAVDVNSMLVSEANALSEMAKELGLEDESLLWKQDADRRAELINKYMWDEKTGFYYNVDKKDNDFTFSSEDDLKRKEIIGFLPLWAGIAGKHQAEKLMEHLKNPEEFWRNFGVPTLSASDSYYSPIGYWNGPVWVPWQYLVLRGLINYGYNTEAKELVNKVLDNIAYQLKTNHYFWEFYSADDYQAGWNKTYIWTGILARMLIDINKL